MSDFIAAAQECAKHDECSSECARYEGNWHERCLWGIMDAQRAGDTAKHIALMQAVCEAAHDLVARFLYEVEDCRKGCKVERCEDCRWFLDDLGSITIPCEKANLLVEASAALAALDEFREGEK